MGALKSSIRPRQALALSLCDVPPCPFLDGVRKKQSWNMAQLQFLENSLSSTLPSLMLDEEAVFHEGLLILKTKHNWMPCSASLSCP